MEDFEKNILPEEENNVTEQPVAQEPTPAEEAVRGEPVTEEAIVEEVAAESVAEESVASEQAPAQPASGYTAQTPNAYQQGSYTYQNPNPYQQMGYNPYTVPPKKRRNTALILVSCIAAGLMLLCCGAIVAAMIFGFNGSVVLDDNGKGDQQQFQKEEATESNKEVGNAQRDEEAVYNMPEINKEEKKGEILSLVDINKKVKNSVVGILISEKNEGEAVFSGSGFIISQDGYIMTNDHVVEGAARVTVVLSDGITEYDATIVGEDERSDLAILKVEASGLEPAELGDSDQLEVGETVVAIGNPYGMELAGSVTDGIVSAMNRKINMNGSFMTLIQTNAAINPGNSGGPLVNAYGQVIGITSSKLVATDYEGIGFAIPINHVVDMSEELIRYGYIKTRAYIGIQGSDLTAAYARYHGLPQGVYVSYVDPKCDAAKKGLKEGDVIVGFNGKVIKSMAELNALKDSFRPGDNVSVKVWRDDKEFEITITLTEAF
ncbi:MAG: trypsin-like peptidase domain-containing protein [Clostridia bacterium]|nr:trypsin-like peptidase domain-containing protein [Clostridia bacterium]